MFSLDEHAQGVNDLPYPVDEVVAAIEEHGLEVRASDRPATTDAILRLLT
jgi:hypothetical protein